MKERETWKIYKNIIEYKKIYKTTIEMKRKVKNTP